MTTVVSWLSARLTADDLWFTLLSSPVPPPRLRLGALHAGQPGCERRQAYRGTGDRIQIRELWKVDYFMIRETGARACFGVPAPGFERLCVICQTAYTLHVAKLRDAELGRNHLRIELCVAVLSKCSSAVSHGGPILSRFAIVRVALTYHQVCLRAGERETNQTTLFQLVTDSRPHLSAVSAGSLYTFMSLSGPVKACYKACTCLPDLKYINCSGGNISDSVSSFSSNTEYLDLSENLLTTLPSGSFGALWGLKVLLLSTNNITSVAGGAFINLLSLQRLDLSGNHIGALGDAFGLGLGSLSQLLLARNRLTALECGTFRTLDGLTRLDLSANLIQLIQPGAFGGVMSLRRLNLEGNRLRALGAGLFSTLHSLEVLSLRGNPIGSVEPGVFTPLPSLALLDLSFNQLSGLHYKVLLGMLTPVVHVMLEGNPWHCDCELQRVFEKLGRVRRIFLDDYRELRCSEPAELRGRPMTEVDSELCMGETVIVLILTVMVFITVVTSVIMAEKSKRSGEAKDEESRALEAYYDY
ncbi:Phospholipase A2 inhibitor [Merluccius polli]|uniref:Phospholipase A2 inhibitor n=1 Tax=Merluccius polli TaxID=89951 RepID=A0AA47N339_MERPO|nr:Phospholipase A2 inhibitor [Merluccius polli]